MCSFVEFLNFALFQPEFIPYFVCLGMQFFEMQRHDAVKALEIYKRAGQQVRLTFIDAVPASDSGVFCRCVVL